jgi:hypothetical protein
MGVLKEWMTQREDLKGAAEDVAIAAGLGNRCEIHGEFVSEFAYEDLLVTAYKIGNARITKGEIDLGSMVDRKDFTDLIRQVVEFAPSNCPTCDRIVNSD